MIRVDSYGLSAKAYHAGMDASLRSQVHTLSDMCFVLFEACKIRVCVLISFFVECEGLAVDCIISMVFCAF
jgi:hypothetical protein